MVHKEHDGRHSGEGGGDQDSHGEGDGAAAACEVQAKLCGRDVQGDEVHQGRGEVSLQSIQTGMS